MNPFELRGPEFLFFYAVLAVVLTAISHLLRRLNEAGQPGEGHAPLRDPYTIAYLRGGKNEAIRLATVSLIERELLELRNVNELVTRNPGASSRLGIDPIEREVLEFFKVRRQAPDAFKVNASNWSRALAPRQEELERAGLMPDAARRSFRNRVAIAGASLLTIVATMKVLIGLERNRPVMFLVVLAIFCLIAYLAIMFSSPRTRRGDAALADIREIFSGLVRATSGSADMVMVGAVFGMAALPLTAMPYLPALYPQAAKGDGSGNSGCGSSCGSSCGGGGGCGGGGCGGCGS